MNKISLRNNYSSLEELSLSTSLIKKDNFLEDKKKAEMILFYRKDAVIRYLNNNVSYSMFPIKIYKIEDISFGILSSGKLLILLKTNDNLPIRITLKDGKIILYDSFGTISIGSRVEYSKQLISKTQDVLFSYFSFLDKIKTAYPNRNIFFGNSNREEIEMIAKSEEFCNKIKKYRK